MPTLTLRNIEQALVDLLERRAAKHRRSMDAEHREILRAALVRRPPSFKEHLLSMPVAGPDFSRITRSKARRVKVSVTTRDEMSHSDWEARLARAQREGKKGEHLALDAYVSRRSRR